MPMNKRFAQQSVPMQAQSASAAKGFQQSPRLSNALKGALSRDPMVRAQVMPQPQQSSMSQSPMPSDAASGYGSQWQNVPPAQKSSMQNQFQNDLAQLQQNNLRYPSVYPQSPNAQYQTMEMPNNNLNAGQYQQQVLNQQQAFAPQQMQQPLPNYNQAMPNSFASGFGIGFNGYNKR